jgi:hypothetical protein
MVARRMLVIMGAVGVLPDRRGPVEMVALQEDPLVSAVVAAQVGGCLLPAKMAREEAFTGTAE